MSEKPVRPVTEVQHHSSVAAKIRERLASKTNAKVLKYTKDEPIQQVKNWIPLGEFFELASGGPGFPCGHITQLIGKRDSGKTTMMLTGIVNCQKMGGLVYMIEPEAKFSFERLKMMGGDPETVEYITIESLEDAWNTIIEICYAAEELRAEGFDAPIMICWDSIPTTVPNKILEEKDSGDSHVAVEAKINNKNIRKVRQLIRKTDVCCVFINHYYMSQPKSPYEQPELIIKGGEEMGFLSTLIVHMKQGKKIERTVHGKRQKIGRWTKVEIVKGHFHGRTIVEEVPIVDIGILTPEELEEYQKSLRGQF